MAQRSVQAALPEMPAELSLKNERAGQPPAKTSVELLCGKSISGGGLPKL